MKLDDLPDDVCEWCKTPLPDTRRAGQIYCNKRCAQKHLDYLEKRARLEARTGLVCRECGRTFTGARQGQKFCSKACARMAMRKRTWGYRTCRICESRFLPNHKDQRICVPPMRYMECVDRLKARLRCEAVDVAPLPK